MNTDSFKREAERWLLQAEDDLEAVEGLIAISKYAQACFLAQQSAEKSLKGVGYFLNKILWGHSVKKLIDELREEESIKSKFASIYNDAVILDQYYIPTRYPNGLPDILPKEAYTKDNAETALKITKEIIKVSREIILSVKKF